MLPPVHLLDREQIRVFHPASLAPEIVPVYAQPRSTTLLGLVRLLQTFRLPELLTLPRNNLGIYETI